MGIRDIAAQTVRDEAKVAAQKVLDTATQVAGRSSHIAHLREISEKLLDPDLVFRILDNLSDGILLVDKKGVIQLVNKQTEAMFGYTRFELDGSPLSLLIPSVSRDRHAKFMREYFENPTKRPIFDVAKHGLKLVGLHKDGTEITLDISLTPIETPHDIFVVAVTRRKVAWRAILT